MRQLEKRALPEGGFASRDGEPFRSDATALGILALYFYDRKHALLDAARTRLSEAQAADGSVGIAENHSDAYWPTALSVLSWDGSTLHTANQRRGAQFLLKTTGRHWKKPTEYPDMHDTSIPGWAWIANTHSWVEPTSVALCALRRCGLVDHKRVSDGVRLLVDRQLPSGGWNCGNIRDFGNELHPNPESTGAALQALVGLVPVHQIQKSLDYLNAEIGAIRTPIALGWTLLGLGAWGEVPQESEELIYLALARQERYGGYDTSSLALLLLPLVAHRGILERYFADPPRES